jgi:hypothetical protein
MIFNLSRYNENKKTAGSKEPPSLPELYPEGKTEAIKEYGHTDPTEAATVTTLFPEGDEIPDSLDRLTDNMVEEIRKQKETGTQRVSEILQLQGEDAEAKLRSAKGNPPLFRRLLVLTAFHPNPYVRWTGIHDFGDEVSELHLKYLLQDRHSGIQSQAQWETERRTKRETPEA